MTSATSTSTAPVEASLDPRLLRTAAVVIVGTFMSILDTTIVNVAMRELSKKFGAPLATAQWISTGYMLALATVIPLTGWAADRFGTKRLYMGAIAMFVLGSALCGAAWSAGSLIFFRVLQGLGGGMIMPAGMTILTHAAGPTRMGRMMGIVGIPMLLAPIIGPILGGWLVDDVSWRWIFFVNVPLGVIALFAAQRVFERDEPKSQHTLDWAGLLMLSPGLAIFVYGLAQTAAGAPLESLGGGGPIVLGLLLVIAFVVHARLRPGALIDVKTFARRAVGAPARVVFLFCTAFFGVALLMPLYFQLVRGDSALHSGLQMSAQGIGAMLSMPIAARLTDKLGPRRVVTFGVSMVTVGMASLSQISSTTSSLQMELTLLVMGLGMGSTMMPAMSAALASLERHAVARVSAGLNVLQRVGGSIGTALLAVVLSHELAAVMPASSSVALHGEGAVAAPSATASPALGVAFGHTFTWALVLVVCALGAALFIRREPVDAVAPDVRDILVD